MFLYYLLLRLLSKGQTVALQRENRVLIFREGGVEMHEADLADMFFRGGEKPWALVDSSETSRHPCTAFQKASQSRLAWFVLTTSASAERHGRLRKECMAGLFVMEFFTREESRALRLVFISTILLCLAYSLSIIHNLDVQQFMTNYDKWGPSARTCLMLAWRTISEEALKGKVENAAKKFAENPRAITMEAESDEGSHWLFVSLPDNPERDRPVLRVGTPYLREFVVQAIANIDAAKQVSFYTETSSHPYFRSAFGYIFEKFFYLWLYSDPDNEILCKAWPSSAPAEPAMSTRSKETKSKTPEPVELSHLQPVGADRVFVYGGETNFDSVNKQRIPPPHGWIPASRSASTFDAVICTSTHIITIQATIAAKHTVNPEGFDRLMKNLPDGFHKKRSWCHVFVTDRDDVAAKLGRKHYVLPSKMKILIHTAVLDISLFQYHPKLLKRAIPSVSRRQLLYNHSGTYWSHQRESDEVDAVGMDIDAEGV